jgi:arylformamidase
MVHWPGDPQVKISRTRSLSKGDTANVSKMQMGSHTGTHMDAPYHFIRSGKTMDQMPLDATLGEARVIEIRDKESVKPEELKRHIIRRGDRILLKTRNSSRCWKINSFVKDFVYISSDAAKYLARRGIRAVGIDYLSVGGYKKDGALIHRTLLKAGIWIIEGLNLSRARSGKYELICLPLKFWNGDGAPARAVLRRYKKG